MSEFFAKKLRTFDGAPLSEVSNPFLTKGIDRMTNVCEKVSHVCSGMMKKSRKAVNRIRAPHTGCIWSINFSVKK